jgi:hypothetical protein
VKQQQAIRFQNFSIGTLKGILNMTDPMGRIAKGNELISSQITDSRTKATRDINPQGEASSFLKLITTDLGGVSSAQRMNNVYPAVGNRDIRSRVLEEVVRSTLENTNHPYYSIGTEHREQMRMAIIEQLEVSHYLRLGSRHG